ncbi:MAG: hypothetical protein JXR19_02240 [Bacteroidia bacterium]
MVHRVKSILLYALIILGVWACSKGNSKEDAEMYDPSPLSMAMRSMESFSEQAKYKLLHDEKIEVPSEFFEFYTKEATRDEHKEAKFQSLAVPYVNALKGIERGDSQMYFYQASIQACKACHSQYCAGPLAAINQLDID